MRPALIIRIAVATAALVSFGAGLVAYVNGWVPAGENLPLAGALLILVAAITRRYGIALPGNGFSSFVLGVMLFAILDRGWAFAAIVAPFAMLVGDVLATIPGETRVLLFAALALAIAGSLHVLRLGVRADELQLIQRLAQAIAAELTLSHSFQRVQELTRQLVPWEQMGFARYDARTRQMELVADTASQPGAAAFRFDSDAGLTGEALRLRRPLVAHGLARDQVILPGGETPGSEMLIPLYHAGQLVGLWSVRHSNPTMYRQSDGELLELLAPQLALMVAIDGSLRPVT